MFCSKCGKQIEEGSRFCPYCGNVQEPVAGRADNSMYSNKDSIHMDTNHGTGILKGMSAVDIIIAVVYLIMLLWWTIQFFSNLKGSWIVYEFMGPDAKFMGMIFYIIPYALVLCFSIIGILGVKKREYHISTSVIIVVIGLIVKIGSVVFNSISYKTYVIVAQRVFAVYGAIGISTIVLGVITAVLLYAKMNQER